VKLCDVEAKYILIVLRIINIFKIIHLIIY